MRRGEIRRYTFALPDKRRPVLLLSHDAVLPSLNEVIVVPGTRPIRGIDTEVALTEDDRIPDGFFGLQTKRARFFAGSFAIPRAPPAFDFSNLETPSHHWLVVTTPSRTLHRDRNQR